MARSSTTYHGMVVPDNLTWCQRELSGDVFLRALQFATSRHLVNTRWLSVTTAFRSIQFNAPYIRCNISSNTTAPFVVTKSGTMSTISFVYTDEESFVCASAEEAALKMLELIA